MKDLAGHLEDLYAYILKWGGQDASWSCVGIVEEAAIERVGKVRSVPHSALSRPADYAPRFEALLMRGYSWLNMNAAGIVGDRLIVVIELPSSVTEGVGRTSVNYSGPSIIDGKVQWDADGFIIVT